MAHFQDRISDLLRDARRQRGIKQSELARQVGCSQSAISMFEAGKADALSRERIVQIATFLEVDITVPAARTNVYKYCPVPDCPSNIPYVVGGRICLLPTMIEQHADHRNKCRYCGEILEDRCPNPDCDHPTTAGACCEACGTAYIAFYRDTGDSDALTWADTQRKRIREIRLLSEANQQR